MYWNGCGCMQSPLPHWDWKCTALLCGFCLIRRAEPTAKGSIGRISVGVNWTLHPRKLTCNLKCPIGTETSYHIQTIPFGGLNSFGFLQYCHLPIPNGESQTKLHWRHESSQVRHNCHLTKGINIQHWIWISCSSEHYLDVSTCCISLFSNGLFEALRNKGIQPERLLGGKISLPSLRHISPKLHQTAILSVRNTSHDWVNEMDGCPFRAKMVKCLGRQKPVHQIWKGSALVRWERLQAKSAETPLV